MTPPLTSAQKAAARRRRRPARQPHVPDPCPRCGTDLGGAGQVTSRIALSSLQPGSFTWECPACRTSWTEPGRTRR